MVTGKVNSIDLPITQNQLNVYNRGELIQCLRRRTHSLQIGKALDRDKLVAEIAELEVPKNQAKCQFYLIELVKRAKEIQNRKIPNQIQD